VSPTFRSAALQVVLNLAAYEIPVFRWILVLIGFCKEIKHNVKDGVSPSSNIWA
jgi:hypothetical protein